VVIVIDVLIPIDTDDLDVDVAFRHQIFVEVVEDTEPVSTKASAGFSKII